MTSDPVRDEPEPTGGISRDLAQPSEPQSPLPAREIVPDIDPWAHRRTEPRPLAFFWSMFLAVATMLALGSAAATGIVTHDVYRPAVRSVLALIAIGLTVLWPMMRLSQTIPESGTRAWIAKDLVVLLAPTQAVVWPQGFFFLAWWPWSVVAAISAMLAAWTATSGAVLAIACDRIVRSHSPSRTPWMAAVVCVSLLGPVITLGVLPAPRTNGADVRLMTSAATGVFELGRDRPWTGRAAAVYPGHWYAIGGTFAVAAALWLVPVMARLSGEGSRGPLGAGLVGDAGLDSMAAPTPQEASKDPGLPGAREAHSPGGD